MLKLRSRNRADSEIFNEAISREIVLAEWHATRARFERLLSSVLAGRVPDYLLVLLPKAGEFTDEIEAWRLENVENLALVSENVSIAAANEDRLRATDLWDVCSDVGWLESVLIEDLRSHLT